MNENQEQRFTITTDWLGGWDMPATIADIQEVLEDSPTFVYEVETNGDELRVWASRKPYGAGKGTIDSPNTYLNWQQVGSDTYYLVIGELLKVAPETREQTEIEKQGIRLWRNATHAGKKFALVLEVGDTRTVPSRETLAAGTKRVTLKVIDAEIELRKQLQSEFVARQKAVQDAFNDKQHALMLKEGTLDFGVFPAMPDESDFRQRFNDRIADMNIEKNRWGYRDEPSYYGSNEYEQYIAAKFAIEDMRQAYHQRRDEYFESVSSDETIILSAADVYLHSNALRSFKVQFIANNGKTVEIAILGKSESELGQVDVLVLENGIPVNKTTFPFYYRFHAFRRANGMKVDIREYHARRYEDDMPEYSYEFEKAIGHQHSRAHVDLKLTWDAEDRYDHNPDWQRKAEVNWSSWGGTELEASEAYIQMIAEAVKIGKAWERIGIVERAEVEAIYWLINEFQSLNSSAKIYAIKAWREVTGFNLHDAKNAVEDIMEWII